MELLVHAGGGVSAAWLWKRDYLLPLVEGGAGFRVPIGKRGYIEITARSGWPFLWGAGLGGGISLGEAK